MRDSLRISLAYLLISSVEAEELCLFDILLVLLSICFTNFSIDSSLSSSDVSSFVIALEFLLLAVRLMSDLKDANWRRILKWLIAGNKSIANVARAALNLKFSTIMKKIANNNNEEYSAIEPKYSFFIFIAKLPWCQLAFCRQCKTYLVT